MPLAKYGFLTHVCLKDYHLSYRLVKQIQQHHPGAEIAIICDGIMPDRFYRLMALEPAVHLFGGAWLKSRLEGHLWIRRMLGTFLSFDWDVMVRLDPDSSVNRPFRGEFPDGDVFGNVQYRGHLQAYHVRGGGLGMRRATAQAVLNSSLLPDPQFTQPNLYTYERHGHFKHSWEAHEPGRQLSDDLVLGAIYTRLGLTLSQWDDVWIGFREPLPDDWEDYAITHEHPLLEDHPKVMGLGLSKTGTTSLAAGLRRIGYQTRDFPLKIDQISAVEAATDIQFTDAPTLDSYYPGSKFVLTLRDENDWLASCDRWHHAKGVNWHPRWKQLGCVSRSWVDYYRQYNQGVIDYFSDRPSDLLVLNICDGEGYEKLCPFLGEPVISEVFPHENPDSRQYP